MQARGVYLSCRQATMVRFQMGLQTPKESITKRRLNREEPNGIRPKSVLNWRAFLTFENRLKWRLIQPLCQERFLHSTGFFQVGSD